MRLGELAHVGGQRRELTDDAPWLELRAHQSAVVQTLEEIRLPRFLVARWNLKVTMVYEGLLWTGALQVDPGWYGKLVWPIYNLADRTVWLKYGSELFAMDFVRTSRYDPVESKPYEQKRGSLEQYDRHRIRSAPYEALAQLNSYRDEVKAVEDRVEELTTRMFSFAVLTFAVLAITISAIGLLVAAQSFKLTLSIPIAISTILSVIAIVVAVLAIRRPAPTGVGQPGNQNNDTERGAE